MIVLQVLHHRMNLHQYHTTPRTTSSIYNRILVDYRSGLLSDTHSISSWLNLGQRYGELSEQSSHRNR